MRCNIKENTFFKDSFWAVVGNGSGYGLLLLAGIIIARLLGKDLYGEYGFIKTTMFQFAAFATLGLGYTATKFIAQYKTDIGFGIPMVKCHHRLSSHQHDTIWCHQWVWKIQVHSHHQYMGGNFSIVFLCHTYLLFRPERLFGSPVCHANTLRRALFHCHK